MVYFIDIEEGTKEVIDCPLNEWLSDWCGNMGMTEDEWYESITDFNESEEYYKLEGGE